MKQWQATKLGEIARIRRGASPRPKGDPRYFGGEIPWLKIGDVPPGSRFVSQTEEGVTPAGRNLSVYVEPDTLLLSNSATVGRPVITKVGTCIHDGWLAIDQYESKLRQDFLFWCLIWSQSEFERLAPSGTQKNLNIALVSRFEVPIPPLMEQERIVKLLDEADELRNLRAQADHRTADLIPALFHEMFGDPVTNPKGWPHHKLPDLCDGKDGIKAGPFGSSLKKECYTTEGPRVYGQEQVIASDFSVGDYHISEAKFSEMAPYVVKGGDVLISLVGTIGKVAVVPEGIEPGIINPRLLRVRPHSAFLNPTYLTHVLTAPSVVQFFESIATGITMGVLNAGLLKRLDVPQPPLPLQEGFAQRVAEIRELEAEQAASRDRLEELFQSLLHRAFNGEL